MVLSEWKIRKFCIYLNLHSFPLSKKYFIFHDITSRTMENMDRIFILAMCNRTIYFINAQWFTYLSYFVQKFLWYFFVMISMLSQVRSKLYCSTSGHNFFFDTQQYFCFLDFFIAIVLSSPGLHYVHNIRSVVWHQ